jgi:predicted RNA-binding protein with RPS1 domain
MPRKKEILEDQETEMLTLVAPEEAAEIPDLPADPPEAYEEMPSESPEEDSGEPVNDSPGQDAIQSEDAPSEEQPAPTDEEPQDAPQAAKADLPDEPTVAESPVPRRRMASAAASEQESAASPAPTHRRGAASTAPAPRVLAIDEESRVQSAEEKEAYLWMELRNSLRTKRSLTGILGGVERTSSGLPLAIVYYKDMRVVIPATEMNIRLEDHRESSDKELHNRYAQILSWMMGAEIEFTVSGLDRRSGSVVASRADAMRRKQRQFFLTPGRDGRPLVQEGTVAEARVIAVSERVVRVEIFGVEFPIFAREVAWEWVDDCNDYYGIGDRVLVKILSIDRSDPGNIRLQASIRETVPNPARENIKKCVVQGKYIGKVTDVNQNAIYVWLNVGVNAVALAVHDRRTPCRKDDVSFVVTRIDEEAGIAIGIITRIIKQYL